MPKSKFSLESSPRSDLMSDFRGGDRRCLMECQVTVQQGIKTARFASKKVVTITGIQPLSNCCICICQGSIHLQASKVLIIEQTHQVYIIQITFKRCSCRRSDVRYHTSVVATIIFQAHC